MLPPYLRLIQGDGICYETLEAILENMKKNKWSADNVAFGSGGALLQKMNRDTYKCAYKCSFALINGKSVSTQRSSPMYSWRICTVEFTIFIRKLNSIVMTYL